MTLKALIGASVFTGARLLQDHAVLLHNDKIADVLPVGQLPQDIEQNVLSGGILAPGFIDAQVNGGGGVLFNATPEAEAIVALGRAHARFGSTSLLPTYITDRPEGMALAIAAAKAACARTGSNISGLHLEGPFLSEARKGAHDAHYIRPLTDTDVDVLLDAGLDTLVLTVAAENASPRLIRRLSEGGIIVSLGHTDADYDTVMAAADAGARGITHLFNAMSQMQHRNPGVVGAALEHGGLWCGIIADGYHVHDTALKMALRAKRGPAQLFIVTDAMPTAGDENDIFWLNGRKVTRLNGRLTLEDGTLAGSDLTMDQALRYTVQHLETSREEALRMASLYPAQFLRLDTHKGRIAAGFDADLVHLNETLQTQSVWIKGKKLQN
eukprot:gene17523-17723_t